MAKTPKAPRKGKPIEPNEVNNNLDKGKTVDLNFKIDADFKKQFKQAALDEGLTQKKLLILIFEQYKNK